MKKVGAKPGQLVRSASRRGKTPSRFHFNIHVERLFGQLVKPGSSYYVKWSRGVKVAQTNPVRAEKEHSGGSKVVGGLPIAQKMSLLVTLYRKDEFSKTFDEKDARIVVISVSPKGQEKTVAKMHFDLSHYAGVPSSSVTKVLQISEKISMKATIDSRLTQSGPSGPGSGGASSAISGLSAHSSEGANDGEEDGDADDLADLKLDDVPDPETRRTPSRPRAASSGSDADAGAMSSSSALESRRRAQGGGGGDPGSSQFASSERNAHGGALRPTPDKTSSSGASSVSKAMEIAREMRELREKRGSSGDNTVSSAGGGALERTQASHRSGLTDGRADARSDIAVGGPGLEDHRLRAELDALKEEHENVLIDLRRVQDKRKRLEAAHEAEVATLREKLVAASALGASSSSKFAADYEAAQHKLAETTSERDQLRAECDTMRTAARDAERYREKNKELSREVDRLTVAVASGGGAAGSAEFENRLARLQGEKEAMEGKLRAHQTHSAKVKETYQKLTTMYNQLRDDNVELQEKIDKLEQENLPASASSVRHEPNSVSVGGAEVEALQAELRDAKVIARNIEASKDSLQRDHDRLTVQLLSLQDRLDQMAGEVREVREEADSLHAEVTEVTAQRDNALKRLQSSRVGDRGLDSSAAAASEARLAEAMSSKEQAEREGVRIRQRVMELERELGDLTEDLEYEKAEKAKAREERDALRESARALEKRTSEASQAADAVHSLKRQLSTHKMRDADQSAMITDLREEVDRLQSELDNLRMRSSGAGVGSHIGGRAGGGDGDVLETLVITKLALATAEDEKLQLQFGMKTLRASEKAVQERLAAHASRLEVKLSEANDELDRCRRRLSSLEFK